MISLKKCNFITGDIQSVSFAVTKIVDFLEIDGRNILLFCKSKHSNTKNTSLNYLINNTKEFNDLNQLKDLLNNSSVVFRCDLIIFDLWHLPLNSVLEYQTVIDKIGIDYIIVTREYHYKSSDDVNDYHISYDSPKNQNRSDFWITDKISGWTSNLDDLKISYIRDKKINQVFGK